MWIGTALLKKRKHMEACCSYLQPNYFHNIVAVTIYCLNCYGKMDEPWNSILYTENFVPFADSQNKAKIYSVFLHPVYSSIYL